MSTRLNPYLSFRDNARQAMEFYRSVFGGELSVMTFGEAGMSQGDADRDLVMHAQLETDDGYTLMGSDTPAYMASQARSNSSVSLSGDESETLQAFWDKLSDGAEISTPLEKAPWGDTFGMLTDRFGVPWLVNIAGSAS